MVSYVTSAYNSVANSIWRAKPMQPKAVDQKVAQIAPKADEASNVPALSSKKVTPVKEYLSTQLQAVWNKIVDLFVKFARIFGYKTAEEKKTAEKDALLCDQLSRKFLDKELEHGKVFPKIEIVRVGEKGEQGSYVIGRKVKNENGKSQNVTLTHNSIKEELKKRTLRYSTCISAYIPFSKQRAINARMIKERQKRMGFMINAFEKANVRAKRADGTAYNPIGNVKLSIVQRKMCTDFAKRNIEEAKKIEEARKAKLAQ